MPFNACTTSVEPDQSAHPQFVRNDLINQKANSADPDQMAGMWIWIYTVCPRHKGIYIEERVNLFKEIVSQCLILLFELFSCFTNNLLHTAILE
jgi:hypothetical protein